MTVNRDKNAAQNWNELRARGLGQAYIDAGFGTKSRRTAWQRRDVLRALYELAGGKAGVVLDLADVMTAADVSQEQVFNALDYLEQEGMLTAFNGNCVTLLPKGITSHMEEGLKPYRMVPVTALEAGRRGPGLARALPKTDADHPRGERRRASLRTG